jgi:hypothetical protein
MTINLTSHRNICLNLSKTNRNIRTHIFPNSLRVLVGETVFRKIIQKKGRKEGRKEGRKGGRDGQ